MPQQCGSVMALPPNGSQGRWRGTAHSDPDKPPGSQMMGKVS